jgi:hypothetical protein
VIVFELTGREDHPVYQQLEVSNGNRQYDFLYSIVLASLAMGRPFLSQHIIKAFNFQAITCLHINPGEYRPCHVSVGAHTPPEFYRVPALMDDFVNLVNRNWDQTDAVAFKQHSSLHQWKWKDGARCVLLCTLRQIRRITARRNHIA